MLQYLTVTLESFVIRKESVRIVSRKSVTLVLSADTLKFVSTVFAGMFQSEFSSLFVVDSLPQDDKECDDS